MRIDLHGVRKKFGKQEVLRGVDLTIPHGQRVALVGPNGSGKSTLLRVMMGLVSYEGEVRLDALSPFEDRMVLARRMAYVPQVAPQLGASCGDLVRAISHLRDLDPEHIRAVATRLDLDLELVDNKPFRALSGGMKHKLLLSLALGSGATLFILDEPTASLDIASRQRLETLLDEAATKATVLLCSHRAEEVQRQAERIVELSEGRIIRDLAAVAAPRVEVGSPRTPSSSEDAG